MESAGYGSSEDVKGDITRLREILGGPVFAPPLMMSGGLIISLITTALRAPEGWGSVALAFSLFLAFTGGALEIYYLTIIFWSFRVLKGGYLSFIDFITVLVSVGLYYMLVGIVFISFKLRNFSSQAGCLHNWGVLASVATLGFTLSYAQRDAAVCLQSKLSELQVSLEAPSQGEVAVS